MNSGHIQSWAMRWYVFRELIDIYRTVKRLPFIFRMLIGLFVFLFTVMTLFMAVVVVLFVGEMSIQILLLGPIEKRYGCTIGSPYIMINGKQYELLTVEDVIAYGAFDQAQIQKNEIIVGERSIGLLLLRMNKPRGTPVELQIVPGGNGPPLENRPRRVVSVIAP